MLVKRDNRLSGLFDPYSDGDDAHPSWPDDDPLAEEKSAVRPAPRISGAPSEPACAPDVSPRSEATPHFWDVRVPASSTPLPVVRATSEPTQRGLGIPPPPTSEEAAAFAQLPSLTSVAPLSLDSFDDGAAPKASPQSNVPLQRTDTENERVTVRAPAKSDSTSRTRRRWYYALAALLVAGLLLAMMRHHPATADDRVTVPASRVSPPQLPAAAAAPMVKEPAIENVVRAKSEPSLAETPTGDPTPKPGEVVRTRATRSESRRSRRLPASRRARHDETKAEPPPVRDPVAHVASGLEGPSSPTSQDAPAPEHRLLSLPPR
jgi:hypothetical protein